MSGSAPYKEKRPVPPEGLGRLQLKAWRKAREREQYVDPVWAFDEAPRERPHMVEPMSLADWQDAWDRGISQCLHRARLRRRRYPVSGEIQDRINRLMWNGTRSSFGVRVAITEALGKPTW